MATVTCHTAGCVKENEPVSGLLLEFPNEETGEMVHVDAVACGACGQEITDITESET